MLIPDNNIIGIDVGLTGAICIKSADSFFVFKMPVVKEEKSGKKWYDYDSIVSLLDTADKDSKVYMELQRPMEKQGVVSVFRLGRGFGLLEGIVRGIFSNVSLIDPKTWQHFLYKKFLLPLENDAFKDEYLKYADYIEEPYKSIYLKKASIKSAKITKLKTFYCLYFSGLIKYFPKKDLKDHDKIDAFMISAYGAFQP